MKIKSGFLQGQQGYIALMSAIVLAFVLTALAATASASIFYSRYNVLNSEYKRVSLGLAESCANEVLLKAAQNFNYTLVLDPSYDPLAGSIKVLVGMDSRGAPEYCSITSASFTAVGNSSVGQASAEGQYKGAFSKVEIATVAAPADSINNLDISLWQESP